MDNVLLYAQSDLLTDSSPGNLVERGVVGRFWRFAVLGDPTVELFLSRDSDRYTYPAWWLGKGG